MMKIYLIRHGQTTGDIEDRYGGDYDDRLTEEGKNQSKNLAEELKDKNVKTLFVSPRIRAKETAEILEDDLRCGMEIVENIRERNAYGILTGMTKSEAQEKYPKEVELVKDTYNTITDAEPYEDFKNRIINTLNELSERQYQTIGIVTHGGPICCIFREILKKGEFEKLGDCAWIELEKENNGFKVIAINNAKLENKV